MAQEVRRMKQKKKKWAKREVMCIVISLILVGLMALSLLMPVFA